SPPRSCTSPTEGSGQARIGRRAWASPAAASVPGPVSDDFVAGQFIGADVDANDNRSLGGSLQDWRTRRPFK
ncbi:MAG: hypothetical protein AAFR70_10760, partial [Pseudomonadota bacterium]